MSLEKIIDKINADAKQKADQIILEAKQKADQIIQQSMEEARLRKEAILSQAKQNALDREKRVLQMAHLSGRKAILAEKQKAIHFVFNSALNRLAGLNPGKYRQIIRHMLLKAVKSGREEIIMSAKDRKILDQDWLRGFNKEVAKDKGIPGELKFSRETRDIKGGFILRDGQIEINSSFEAILKYNHNELESNVATAFFEKQ